MWPPALDELKTSQKLPLDDHRDDDQLQQGLDGAVEFVERVRGADFNFAMESGSALPDPPADLRLGTLRLGYRWHRRYVSPDGYVSMSELGANRVTTFDPDIDRQLGIGRYRKPIIA